MSLERNWLHLHCAVVYALRRAIPPLQTEIKSIFQSTGIKSHDILVAFSQRLMLVRSCTATQRQPHSGLIYS